MITIKLTRDETRAIQQYFFYYLDEFCQMKERQAVSEEEKIMEHLITDLFNQVRRVIEKKLFSPHNSFSLKFTDSQAIILYKLLLNLPIQRENIWLIELRQYICNIIYTEFLNTLLRKQGLPVK